MAHWYDNQPCGCWDEDYRHRAFTLAAAKPTEPRSRFVDDNCWTMRHYCEKHWQVEAP